MKNIILLVLAGLSLAQEKIDCPNGEAIPQEKKPCLFATLDELSEFSKELKKLECEYKGTVEDNDENYKKTIRKFTTVLVCAGCTVKDVSGVDIDLEGILSDDEKLFEEGTKLVLQISEILGLSKFVPKFVCDLIGGALASQCFEKILKKNIPGLIDSLNKLFCKNNSSELTEDQLIELLINIGCFGDDALKNKGVLEKSLKGLGEDLEPALESLVDTLEELLVTTDLLNDLGCVLVEDPLGKTSLLSGATGSVTEGLGIFGGGGSATSLFDALGGR